MYAEVVPIGVRQIVIVAWNVHVVTNMVGLRYGALL